MPREVIHLHHDVARDVAPDAPTVPRDVCGPAPGLVGLVTGDGEPSDDARRLGGDRRVRCGGHGVLWRVEVEPWPSR